MASGSESGVEATPSSLGKNASRPRRPPRSVSRIFSTSPSSSTAGDVHAPSATNHAVQEPSRATGSQVDKLKGQSRSTDSDLDRTPTKYSHYTASIRDNGTAPPHHYQNHQSEENDSVPHVQASKSRQSIQGGALQRLSVSGILLDDIGRTLTMMAALP